MKQSQHCPIAAAAVILGDKWNLLILREAFRGTSRFKDFQSQTGAAKSVLSNRLANLVEHGILETIDIGEQGNRYAYHLTNKGTSLSTVIIAILQWGNEHIFGAGNEPILAVEQRSLLAIPPLRPRTIEGKILSLSDIAIVPTHYSDQ